MTLARDPQVGQHQPPFLLDPSPFQHAFVTTWLSSTRAALVLAAGSQQLLRDHSRALVDAFADSQLGAEFPIASSQRAWQRLLGWWIASPSETQQLIEAALVELRYSAADLLGQLEREQVAHQQAQAERDRARERVGRELAARREAEQERDAAQARAEQLQGEQQRAERASQRLERELAKHTARLEQVQRERDEQRQRADQERAERRRLERALAEAQESAASSADKPSVNVVRREDDWAVVRDNAKRASAVFDTKREAVERAREIATHEGVEIHVEPANGQSGGR